MTGEHVCSVETLSKLIGGRAKSHWEQKRWEKKNIYTVGGIGNATRFVLYLRVIFNT